MPLTLTDNTTKTFSLSEYKNGLPNLRKISNKTIGDLQTESGILIFPPKVEYTDDDIKDHVNLSKLKTTQTKDKIFDFLPYLFPKYLVAALSQGLYKEYQNKKYNDSNVRGALDEQLSKTDSRRKNSRHDIYKML